ncbi:MAG TPA: TonB-dependent receptor [Bryobacteraceae bacterium]|nr:TonB-dependent receptor [Bryobacteraceae bacterium]
MILATSLIAQTSDANLTGTIVDPSRAAVPGALLKLTNQDTAVAWTATSDEQGVYRFSNMPVGRYTLEAVSDGFGRVTVRDVVLQLNVTQTVNLLLQVAAAASAVTVVEASPALDTTTAGLHSSFGSRQAVQIPLTSDGTLGVLNVSLLSAGVASSGGIGYGTGPSIGGQRPTNNNFMIEGVDANNRAVTGPIINISNEAAAEFTLQQNQFSPEFGHSSGGQFNTILKSGTNQIHGSVYEYFQNRNLNAVDAGYARVGVLSNPRFDQNRFGGSVGGPIRRDRLFYFGALEYHTTGQQASSGATFVPTADGMRTLEGLSGVNRTNLDVLKRYTPAAAQRAMDITVLGNAIPVGMVNTAAPSYINHTRPVASADYNISERDQLRARWIGYRSDSVDPSASLAEFFTPVQIRNHVASIVHFHTFSPVLLSEVRLGYNRSVEDHPAGPQEFPGLDAFPTLQFDDLSLGLGPFFAYPQSNRSNIYQLATNVSWTRGRHALKFGYDGRKQNSANFFVMRQRGEYAYRTLERYLLDLTPDFASRSVGGFPFVGNLLSHYLFANDEFRLRPNLVVSLGLRYEFVDVPHGSQQQALNALSSVPGVIEFRSPKPGYRDFAPRVALAWAPGTTGRTSLRAGFGMAYDQVYQNLGINSLPPQFFTTVDAHAERPADLPGFLAGGGIPATSVPIANAQTARMLTSAWIPDQQRPYSIQWNAGVQQVLARDYIFETRYLGTRGVHLPMQLLLNRVAGVSSARSLPTWLARPSQADLDALALSLDDLKPVNALAPYGFVRGITSFQPRGNSSYHGLATQLTRRYANGLQFVVAHTWSHNIDDSTATVASTLLTPRRPQDFFNLGTERADSALDRRQRFTAGWIYDAPWFANDSNLLRRHLLAGWSFSGTYMAETGAWATVRSGLDANQNADPVGDRSLVNPAGVDGRSSAVTALKNSAGRVVGYLAADPSARYIQAGAGVLPNGGRNTLRLPGINNFDLSLGKKVRVSDRAFVQFRAEAYNAFNHSQFVPGFANSANLRARVTPAANGLLITGNPLFNRTDLAFESNSRTMQLVLRLEF